MKSHTDHPAVATYEEHLEDVRAMHERMRLWWWDELRRTGRVRKCDCGAYLIRLLGKKKGRKTIHRYFWCDLGKGARDAAPWAYYFRSGRHQVHRCGQKEQLELVP